MLANLNLTEEEPIQVAEFTIDPQPNPKATDSILFHQFFTIPEEEAADVKDSVTSGLPT